MTKLIWDETGSRLFETGVDRAVLFLQDGTVVPWNGLTEITEKPGVNQSPVYFDGQKVQDLVSLGEFSATMKAFGYPKKFRMVEGLGEFRNGVFVGDQPPQVFGLSWRTLIGNDLDSDAGYKIHILYNVTAIANDSAYVTVKSETEPIEFQWNLFAVPEEVPGFRQTAHFIIDSTDIDPWLLEDLEGQLYGTATEDPFLATIPEMSAFLNGWYRLLVVDNGDGTWTATSMRDDAIQFDPVDPTEFTLVDVNAVFTDEDTYQLSDTYDISDVP